MRRVEEGRWRKEKEKEGRERKGEGRVQLTENAEILEMWDMLGE